MEAGGAQGKSSAGGFADIKTPQDVPLFDPDDWVVSVFRTLKAYVSSNVDTDIYEIQFSFPDAADIGRWLPLEKTLIHFEIDDMSHLSLGFGDSIIETEYDELDQTITESEAQVHMVNWDIGIWASAQTGGVTARLQAKQVLDNLFQGPSAYKNLQALGIEIRNWTGGSFIKEEIDDVSIFRVINMTLVVRVFSRKTIGPTPTIEGVEIIPEVTILGDDVVITDEE